MKIWVDDVRPAPEGYVWAKSVLEALNIIFWYRQFKIRIIKQMREPNTFPEIELIDIGYHAGDYAYDGGDYINLLNLLKKEGFNYPIHIHSTNPIGVQNMRAIIQRNGWIEVK